MRIPLDRSNRRSLVVPVRVYDSQGRDSWDLIAAIDTGSSTVAIPREAARRLGYPVDELQAERVIAGEGPIYAPRITLGRVDVEAATAADVEAICHDMPEGSGVDALVGLSFLTRFRVTLDFDAWEMELVPRA